MKAFVTFMRRASALTDVTTVVKEHIIRVALKKWPELFFLVIYLGGTNIKWNNKVVIKKAPPVLRIHVTYSSAYVRCQVAPLFRLTLE